VKKLDLLDETQTEEKQYLRKYLWKKKEQLRKEKQYLRKKEEQLREKEEQLREKQLLLRCEWAASQNALARASENVSLGPSVLEICWGLPKAASSLALSAQNLESLNLMLCLTPAAFDNLPPGARILLKTWMKLGVFLGLCVAVRAILKLAWRKCRRRAGQIQVML
jgi:hypothetical protein